MKYNHIKKLVEHRVFEKKVRAKAQLNLRVNLALFLRKEFNLQILAICINQHLSAKHTFDILQLTSWRRLLNINCK